MLTLKTTRRTTRRLAEPLSCLAVLLLALPVVSAPSKTDPNTLLRSVQKKLFIPEETLRLKMVIREPNGDSKNRDLVLKRMTHENFAAVKVTMIAPADLRGIGYLSKWTDSGEEQWLYSPTINKARRIIPGNRSQKFLDTEFNLDDFSADTYRNFENRIMKEDGDVTVIKSSAVDPEAIYQRVITWVNVKLMQVEKAEYYDKQGNLLKIIVFKDYQKYGLSVRAKTIEVTNVQNKRSTVLTIAKYLAGRTLNRSEFSPSTLRE